MKNSIVVLLLLVSVNIAVAQETMLEKVAQETCEYLETNEIKSLSSAERQQKLGLFIINKYNENEEKFNAEGIDIDFMDGANSGRLFGEKVGMTMAKYCPEVLIALAGDTEEDSNEEVVESFTITGNIVNIVGVEFSSVILKDLQGKTQKFLWLQNFRGSDELIDLNLSDNATPRVELEYRNIECYSPKLNDYIIRKEIVGINFLEN